MTTSVLIVTPIKVVVVGGCGHVGLPLGILLASKGAKVVAYDTNSDVVKQVNAGRMPFKEPGTPDLLNKVLRDGNFSASDDASSVAHAEHVIVVIGTPVDEHLNPNPGAVVDAIADISEFFRAGQHLVLRSTIYPGVTRMVEVLVERLQLEIDVTFCPERIAEGRALEELTSLPQIISGRTEQALERARVLFGLIADQMIETAPEEAELAKLFTNSWRYIKFATANQFFMIANDFGLDFEKVRHAITTNYPRASDVPRPGFAAGPCLFKDTMQLAAFNNNNFTIGHASMLINEGLPLYIVSRLQRSHDLRSLTVGVLGMAFKADSDDTRSSLSYKLKRILEFKAKRVLCADSDVDSDPELVTEDQLLNESDLIVIATPHTRYRTLRTKKLVVDLANVLGKGTTI
jgi:UDP-N-acetyl-D-mannosaminuronic acid dehydrogenase